MNRVSLERLFGMVFEKYGAVTVENLRTTARSMSYRSLAERKDVYRLVGEAHLCAFDVNPRDAIHAIPYCVESGAVDVLERLLGIALDRGNLRLVDAVIKTGRVSMSRRELASWIRDHGVRWFDVFVDDERRLAFVNHEDQELIHNQVAKYFKPVPFWRKVLVAVHRDQSYPNHRRRLIEKLAEGREALVDLPSENFDSVKLFEGYAEENGIDIIRMIQRGGVGGRTSSDVFLVRDIDGIVKIFKRLLVQNNSPFRCRTPNEADIFAELLETSRLVRPHRVVEIYSGHRYMVFPVVYGETYSTLSNVDFNSVVSDVAYALSSLHSRGIMHGDVRRQNILVDPNGGAKLIDLGSGRFVDKRAGAADVPVLLEDCHFATPECVRRRRGSTSSDVFQLGVLVAEKMLGNHPFALPEKFASAKEESEILRHTLPLCLSQPFSPGVEMLPNYLQKMLAIDPNSRLSSSEVALGLSVDGSFSNSRIERSTGEETTCVKRPIVLFPARMGVPHKGHIEYIRRIIKLGYHVRISLQRSYTCTERDPIPKWLVMKMVAQSLLNMGCNRQDFSFMFTPFFGSRDEMRMYFALMPDYERVVAVASGNPDVQGLFPVFPLIDQKAVFGTEGEEYQVRSWGEIVRKAIREGDTETFSEYAASGVGSIRTFEELRADYAKVKVPFVPGRVSLRVYRCEDSEPEHVRLLAYIGPEGSIIAHLKRAGKCVTELNPYSRNSLIDMDGEKYQLVYRSEEFDGTNLVCSFELVALPS